MSSWRANQLDKKIDLEEETLSYLAINPTRTQDNSKLVTKGLGEEQMPSIYPLTCQCLFFFKEANGPSLACLFLKAYLMLLKLNDMPTKWQK